MKIIEYWIHDKESFYKLNGDEWREAKKIAKQCKQGMHTELVLVERVISYWSECQFEGNDLIETKYETLYERKPT